MKTELKSCASTFAGALLACAVLLAGPAPAARAGFDFDEKGICFLTGQAIVGFKAGTTDLTARSVITKLGGDPSKTQWNNELLKNVFRVATYSPALFNAASARARSCLVFFPEQKDVLTFCQNAMAQAQVEFAHPNYEVRLDAIATDPFVTMQWGTVQAKNAPNDPINNGANLPVGKIGNFPEAWNIATGVGVRVAVIDTGCDLRHPDLIFKVYVDLDSGGVISQVFVAPTPGGADNPPFTYLTTRPWDDNGHGTHVAGIVGAQWNNKIGVAGTAPNCTIVPIKVFNNAGTAPGGLNAVMNAVDRAILLNCRVINISASGLPTIPFPVAWQGTLNNVTAARAVIVASMGNQTPTVTPPLFTLRAPACLPGVIAVAAHDYYGTRSLYSMTGPWNCTAAPGGAAILTATASELIRSNVLSTFPTYLAGSTLSLYGGIPGYEVMSGTSQAAPHVAGAAALLVEKNPLFGSGQLWARFARFANRATVPAVVATNNVTTYGTASNGKIAPIFPAYFSLFRPTVPPLKNPTAETLLINTPHNYTLGHGLLDPYRLLAGIESPARFPRSGTIPNSVPTGYVRIFPHSPRHMFTATNTIVASGTAYPPLNGMDQVDRGYVPSSTSGLRAIFRCIMVSDTGTLVPSGTLQLRWIQSIHPGGLYLQTPFAGGAQFVTLRDDGLAGSGDTLANDGIFTYTMPVPFSAGYVAGTSVLFQYLGSGIGLKPNTNIFIGVRIF